MKTGAYPVIAVNIHENKLNKAKEYGATILINSREKDFVEAIREIVGPSGADIVTDGTGNPDIIEKAFSVTHNKGICVLVGVMHHERQLKLNTLPLHFNKKIVGSEGESSRPDIDIPRCLGMHEKGRIDLSRFVSHRYSLEEVNKGIQAMISGEVIHAMIHF